MAPSRAGHPLNCRAIFSARTPFFRVPGKSGTPAPAPAAKDGTILVSVLVGKVQPFPRYSFAIALQECVMKIHARIEAWCIQCVVGSILAKAATHILESKNSNRKLGCADWGRAVTETENPKRKMRRDHPASTRPGSKPFYNPLHFPPTQSCQIGPCRKGFHERKPCALDWLRTDLKNPLVLIRGKWMF